MTHSPEHATLLFLGQVAGWLGVSIAVYLQLMAKERCRARYVWGFFLVGTALIIAHLGLFDLPWYFAGWVPAIGYLLLIAVQIYAYQWVKHHAGLSGVQASLEEAVKFS